MKTCTRDNNLIDKVKNTIKFNNLINKDDTVIIALSGGADSVCMLTVLKELSEEYGFKLKAAHLNHGIRGDEAKRDENFAINLCRELDVEIFVRYKDIPSLSKGISMELVGREERYKFFSELAEKFANAKIAVAHNLNDVAETVVMRLIRGTSVFGLGGIAVKNKNIIRPLINVSREEIECFLRDRKISYVTDSTNFSDDYTRNRIRHKILPEMKLINESFLSSVSKTALRISKASAFIKECALEKYGEITDVLYPDKLLGLSEVLVEYIVSESAYKAGIKELSEQNIKDITELFNNLSGKRIALPGGYEAVRIYSEIKFIKKNKGEKYYKELKIGENYIENSEFKVLIEKSDKGIDVDKLKLPLYARPKEDGDFIEINGMSGRKKLKRLFADEKLPVDKRETYPIIVSGDDVVFALGRCGNRFISDENTKEAYTITIIEGEMKVD